jgi:hypothetical protein
VGPGPRPRWDWRKVAGYFVILGAFLAWELEGIRTRKDDWPAFTDVVKRWLPKWALSLILGGGTIWLLFHFLGS